MFGNPDKQKVVSEPHLPQTELAGHAAKHLARLVVGALRGGKGLAIREVDGGGVLLADRRLPIATRS